MELPSHPESTEAPSGHPEHRNWVGIVVVSVLGALLVLVVVLHLTGVVGPGGH